MNLMPRHSGKLIESVPDLWRFAGTVVQLLEALSLRLISMTHLLSERNCFFGWKLIES